ncbi:uncharacterized protein H6S33_002944 [Morchella sextelata]|uniref:uncharacterized protein n=1 Tax=Morchella sextelata TaxID=1174677 RepID=UPI001D03B90A|nr:uncharacterized protein H6S33_002944 [Morchella sextelata]KAH0606956.1 hypothetical protein H6S33_002944 [Morchella sextelata]
MKLQTVLVLLASVVSVHSQFEGAPVLSQCLELIESGAAQSDTSPFNMEKCKKCFDDVERTCLPDHEGDPNTLAQRVAESGQAPCAESECANVIFGTADAAAKRDVTKRCRGRLCHDN